uniref:Regulatory factor X-associated protein RFXANK-binding domain-containing protein n=1 Tax=Balaenoptera musculus TaxID=9771 RepID=A0A8C0DYI1_BALMU
TEVQAVAEGAGPATLAARSAPGPPPLSPARPWLYTFGTCAKWRGMARRRRGKTRQTCWTLRTPGGGESTASLEDLEDEETHSGGEGGSTRTRSRGSGGGRMSKSCTYEGYSETTSQVAKQCKPWMCKKHRNKMYKDKHKKKKSDQALNCGEAAQAGSAGNVKLEESADNILSTVKERTESFGDQPARPTLLEQVLNQNRLLTKKSRSVQMYLIPPMSGQNYFFILISFSKRDPGGFPGSAVVENLPANAGAMGSSPGLGRSHMPRSN